MSNVVNPYNVYKIYTMATDPIYIGTGGYTIGRVDNTIVRDPITNIPKIPGSSLAGTWRYYMALKLQSCFKDEYKMDRKKRGDADDKHIEELFNNPPDWVKTFSGNRFAAIKCAGQDDRANQPFENAKEGNINKETGHCGRCIVCKTFGYSKNDKSHQGLALFSDLNILFFPVSTRRGVRWITSPMQLESVGIKCNKLSDDNHIVVNDDKIGYLNLGWINLEIKSNEKLPDIDIPVDNFDKSRVVLVSDNLIAQIINSNLEVRTSVSIDPLTGASKEGALFTSEAIPRGTIFYGDIRVMDKVAFGDSDGLPDKGKIFEALKDSGHFYETLGIGGMVTRGFGRMKVYILNNDSIQSKNSERSNEFSKNGG